MLEKVKMHSKAVFVLSSGFYSQDIVRGVHAPPLKTVNTCIVTEIWHFESVKYGL